jgi:hypothetical protein
MASKCSVVHGPGYSLQPNAGNNLTGQQQAAPLLDGQVDCLVGIDLRSLRLL